MPDIPRVVLLGDSIRMSYQPHVASLLEGKAAVVGPADNCQYSLFTLSSLGRWIDALGKPDIVHWNNGLHDCGHNPGRRPHQIPLDMYRDNLEYALVQLRAITPTILWATSTPVHPDRPFNTEGWAWKNEEIDSFNDAASELMAAYDVPVNDLQTLVRSDVEQYLAEDQLHLSEAGQKVCAQAVAEIVSTYL